MGPWEVDCDVIFSKFFPRLGDSIFYMHCRRLCRSPLCAAEIFGGLSVFTIFCEPMCSVYHATTVDLDNYSGSEAKSVFKVFSARLQRYVNPMFKFNT